MKKNKQTPSALLLLNTINTIRSPYLMVDMIIYDRGRIKHVTSSLSNTANSLLLIYKIELCMILYIYPIISISNYQWIHLVELK